LVGSLKLQAFVLDLAGVVNDPLLEKPSSAVMEAGKRERWMVWFAWLLTGPIS